MGEMFSSAMTVLLLLLLLGLAVMATADSPIHCDSQGGFCTVQNFQGLWNDRSTCRVAELVCPSTEADLIEAVAEAVKKNQKIKVVSKLSHSMPKLVCPGGDSGILISTASYNKRIEVNKDAMTVTLDAGVLLKDMLQTIAQAGFAFPYTTSWNGVSVSGMISTGAHGSSLWDKGGNMNEYVVGMSLVIPASPAEGYAKLIYLNSSDLDLNAAKLSLGVLGAISQVTFAIQPLFKRSITKLLIDDDTLEEDIVSHGMAHEFADLTWFPANRKVILRVDDRVPLTTPGEGKNGNNKGATLASATRSKLIVEQVEATHNVTYMRIESAAKLNRRVTSGDSFLNDGNKFTGYPVVGYNHLMQTAGVCLDVPGSVYETATCPLPKMVVPYPASFCSSDPRANGSIHYDISFNVALSKLNTLITDIKKLRDAIPESMWGIDFYNGILMRFIKKSTAYLGNKEDSVDFEFAQERFREPNVPSFHEEVMEEIEQMILDKYGGRPHYGKNRNIGFCDMASRINNLHKFLEVKEKLDPHGLFSSEWSDAVLGIGNASVLTDDDNCAVEGMCVCKEDRHCAPDKGFFCRHGKVYKAARVCHFESQFMEGSQGQKLKVPSYFQAFGFFKTRLFV